MEENKVTIKLEDYIVEHDYMKDLQHMIDDIMDYLLSNSELEDNTLRLTYDARYKILKDIAYKINPAKYNKRLEELKKEEEENK